MPHLPYRANVGIMVVNAQGHVFVGQRLDNSQNAWQMPQGGIDAGEDPRAAALRELAEETGIRADLVQVLAQSNAWLAYKLPDHLIPNFWGGRYQGQKQKWFLMRFIGTDKDVNIQTDHPEFSAWKWLPPDQLCDAIVPFKRAIYQAVLDEFAGYL